MHSIGPVWLTKTNLRRRTSMVKWVDGFSTDFLGAELCRTAPKADTGQHLLTKGVRDGKE